MTDYDTPARKSWATDPVGQGLADTLLADIAIRVQLSPTLHRQATERYEALDQRIQRPDSPLHGRVETTYAQGSMRIGTTINSRVTDDEFDIDALTQLSLPIGTPPRDVLDALYEAVRGKPGSRYFDCTRRRSRCVTVSYSNRMHVDLTPAILQPGAPPRQSWIFEHEARRKLDAGTSLTANPYGFAEWFTQQMPDDHEYSRWFLGRAEAYERILAAEPVPPPVPVGQKSRVIVALQLFKRWRNVQYDTRAGRRPPSVVLSKLVADAATDAAMSGPGLLHVLLQLAQSLLDEFQRCESNSLLIRVANPVCPDDVLTDRWPGNLGAQATFIADLRNLIADLLKLQRTSNIDDIRRILVSLFGEAPALKAIEPHLKTLPRGPMSVTSTGGVIAGTAVAGSSVARTVPRHTFHGDGEDGL